MDRNETIAVLQECSKLHDYTVDSTLPGQINVNFGDWQTPGRARHFLELCRNTGITAEAVPVPDGDWVAALSFKFEEEQP